MIVASDATPLIVLAKIGAFDLLPNVFSRLHISTQVHGEVVVHGPGLPGSIEVSSANWIEVHTVMPACIAEMRDRLGLGLGELSTVALAQEIHADIVLMDELRGRRLAKESGFVVQGTIGILETLYRSRHLADLRGAFKSLLAQRVYLNRDLLNQRLAVYELPPL